MSPPRIHDPTPSPSPSLELAGAVMSPALWEQMVDELDSQTACELLGILHFPHWLAAAANFHLLAEYLGGRHGPHVTVRQALVAELKAGPRPPSGSQETDWWKAIEPHLPRLEQIVYQFMKRRGAMAAPESDYEQL